MMGSLWASVSPSEKKKRHGCIWTLSAGSFSSPPLPYAISTHVASPSLGVEVEAILKSSRCASCALTGGKTRALVRGGFF